MEKLREQAPSAWPVLLVQSVLLVLVTWFAFAPSLDADFVNWDDNVNLLQNQAFRGFSGEHLRWMFTTTHLGPYQPLSWLSFAFDHAVGELDPHVYHRTNLILHVAGAIALFFLARKLFTILPERTVPSAWSSWAALMAALLFAVHPLRCESVCWVTERRDVLSGLFFFVSLHFWLRYATALRGAGRRDYVIALLALLLSLLAKASAIVMPVLLVVIDLGPLREAARARGVRRVVLDKLPAFALAVGFGVFALVGQARDSVLVSAGTHGPLTRGIQAGYAAWFYVSRTLWPTGLQPIYRVPPLQGFFAPEYMVPASAVLALTLLCIWRWRQWSVMSWSWCAFLVILAPVSGLAQSGPQLAADRYTYLACVPFALLAGGAWALPARRTPWLAALVAVAAISALTWRTNVQSRVWHDSRRLWEHTLTLDPDNDVALINLAVLELEQGETATDPRHAHELLLQANEHAARSVALEPEPRRMFNLAATHVRLHAFEPGRQAEHAARAAEISDRARALAIERGQPVEARWCLIHALALDLAGRKAEALPIAEEAMRGTPGSIETKRYVANLHMDLGHPGDAIALLQGALDSAPDNTLLWYDLARACEQAGDPAHAKVAAREGLRRLEREYGAKASTLPWYEGLRTRAGDD